MLESNPDCTPEKFAEVARQGPWGVLTLCLIAVAIVVALWFGFYFLAFLPRGMLQ